MSKTFKIILTCVGAIVGNASAAVTAAPGDLIAAFYEPTATGPGTNTYVLPLGAGSAVREGTTTFTTTNINTDLVTAFGADWATSGTVRFAILGIVGPSDGTVSGDPNRTVYMSTTNGGVLASASGFSITSSGVRGSVALNMDTWANTMNSPGLLENGAVNGGAIVPTSAPNNFASFMPPTSGTSFGQSTNTPYTTLNGTTVGLDVFRVLNVTTAADLTAAGSPTNAAVGVGQFVGGYTLSPTGQLSFAGVPEPSVSLLGGLALALSTLRRRPQATKTAR